jgi:YggT family protein
VELVSWLMRLLFQICEAALEVYIWLIFSVAVIDWLHGFNLVGKDNRAAALSTKILTPIVGPALKPVRYLFRPVRGIDVSPIALILVIMMIRYFLVIYIVPMYS